MKRWIGSFCLLMGLLVLAACGGTSELESEVVEPEVDPTVEVVKQTIYVAPFTELCEGVATQECLLVKESLGDEWELYYGQIEGFDYIAGFTYKLSVFEEAVAEPVADGADWRWVLDEILSQEGSFTTDETTEPEPVAQIWHLDYLVTDSIALDTDITLEFGDGQIAGSGGCNDYVAGFRTVGDNGLAIESIGASRKLCDELISQQERDFFDALSVVNTFEQVDASTLVFQDATGTPVLTFVTTR